MTESKTNNENKKIELHKKLIASYNPESSFSTFLQFYDSIAGVEFDIKYHLRESIKHRIGSIQFFEKELIDQIEKAIEEKIKIKKIGYGNLIEGTILLIRFETFLNSIYSLCDNIAYYGHCLHKGITRGFNKQFNDYQKYLDRYPQYEQYLNLIKSCDWYEDLHTMRTESTHYLPGFVYNPDNGKLGILYRNIITSKERIEIEDLSEYIQKIVQDNYKFLESFGNYMINKYVTDESETTFFCIIFNKYSNGKPVFMPALRTVTYKEYKEKKVGKCINKDVPCLNKEFCPAYKF